MSKKDRLEFTSYLRQCTDRQVQGVYEKEKRANRKGYMHLAEIEAARRGLDLAN